MAFFETYSYKKGAVLSIGSTFIWKILSFVNSLLIAFYFGTRTNCDVYFYILYISAIVAMFFSSLNTNVIIPQAIYLKKESEHNAQGFLNFVSFVYILILLIILIFGFIFPLDIFSLLSKFSQDILSQDILILRLAFLYTFLYILYFFILDIMYVYHIFSINFLFPLNALLPMLILVLFHKTLGLKTMFIGFTLSYFIQILICLFIMKTKLNWPFTHFKITLEKRLKQNIITNQLLVITSAAATMVPVYLMSNFLGGIISALSYAKQLTDSASEVITSKITGIYQIQLNENATTKDFATLNTNYLKVNYLLLFIIVPLSVFTCYFAQDIVNLFFKRGEFNENSALKVVKFLRPLMLWMIVNILAAFAGSLIASTRKIKESFKYMLTRDILIFAVMFFAITCYGPFAYPYALIICSVFSYFIIVLFFKKHIPQIACLEPLKNTFLLTSLNILALIPAALTGGLLEAQSPFVKIFICGIIFLFTLTLLYIPTKQLKKILPLILGPRYYAFLSSKIPVNLKNLI